MRRFCAIGLALLAVLGGCTGPEARLRRYQTAFMDLFDTVTEVTGYAESREAFDGWAAVIRDRMEELHRLYDIYYEYDGVNNLRTVNQNAGIAPVAVDRAVIDMLLLAREWYELSGGAVNVALGPVLRIWHDYRTEGERLPPMEDLTAAAAVCGIDDMIIDEAAGTVFLAKPGMSLDVGSVAKAYAVELAVKAAREAGARSLLISAGGNITAAGPPPDRAYWRIGVQDPDAAAAGTQGYADVVRMTGLTISCSGGYQRYYTVDGQTYHHIIDPATLTPANRYQKVAVIHGDPGVADLLSTALFILPYDEGLALAESAGADALWIGADGGWRATEGYAEVSETLGGYGAGEGT